jgi:hypothetical protein
MANWIKLSRDIQKHWVFSDAEKFKAWCVILMSVNYVDNKDLIDGELIECKRGQSLYSLNSWAKRFGGKWSIQKVRTFFKLLEKDLMITTQGLRKTTRLTVCNYESYQGDQQTDNGQVTDRQQTGNTQLTTTKEGKEREEVKEVKEVIRAKRFLPPTPEQLKAYCIERKNNVDPIKFFDFYESKGWLVGKNKMKDWKACIRTWEKNENVSSAQNSPKKIDIKNAGKFDHNEKY